MPRDAQEFKGAKKGGDEFDGVASSVGDTL